MFIIQKKLENLYLLKKVVYLDIDSGASYELKAAVIAKTQDEAIQLFRILGYSYVSNMWRIEEFPQWNIEGTMFDINEEL